MSRLFSLLLLFASLLLPGALLAQEGKLAQVRREVRQDQPDGNPESTEDGKDTEKRCGSDDDEECGGLSALMLVGPLCPFILPHIALGDNFTVSMMFRHYPYADGTTGYVWFERGAVEDPTEKAEWLRPWSLRLSVEEGNDFDGLNRVGGRALVETRSRFGLQAGWDVFHERLDCGCIDALAMGDLNFDGIRIVAGTESTLGYEKAKKGEIYGSRRTLP